MMMSSSLQGVIFQPYDTQPIRMRGGNWTGRYCLHLSLSRFITFSIHPSISFFVYIFSHQRQGNAFFHCKLGNIPALSLLAPSIAFSRLSIIIIIIIQNTLFLGYLSTFPTLFSSMSALQCSICVWWEFHWKHREGNGYQDTWSSSSSELVRL